MAPLRLEILIIWQWPHPSNGLTACRALHARAKAGRHPIRISRYLGDFSHRLTSLMRESGLPSAKIVNVST